MNIKEIRQMTGLSQKKFSNKYGIPVRTIQDWEAHIHQPPEYLLKLLEKTVKQDYNEERKRK